MPSGLGSLFWTPILINKLSRFPPPLTTETNIRMRKTRSPTPSPAPHPVAPCKTERWLLCSHTHQPPPKGVELAKGSGPWAPNPSILVREDPRGAWGCWPQTPSSCVTWGVMGFRPSASSVPREAVAEGRAPAPGGSSVPPSRERGWPGWSLLGPERNPLTL